MNCYGTVKIYKVDKSYRVKEKGTKRYEIKTHRDERKWKYKLVGTDKYINDIELLIRLKRVAELIKIDASMKSRPNVLGRANEMEALIKSLEERLTK